MGIPGIGRYHVPEYNGTLLERCWDSVIEVCQKVIEAVADIFLWIGGLFVKAFEFIFCIDHPPERIEAEPIFRRYFGEPFIEPVPIERPLLDLHPDLEPRAVPVNLENLRRAVARREAAPYIPRGMTADDFAALCEPYPIRVIFTRDGVRIREELLQEVQMTNPILEQLKNAPENQGRAIDFQVHFPPERTLIGEWAKKWAEGRRTEVDPTSPYFPIIQSAFERRLRITGGIDSSADFREYAPRNNTYYEDANKFTYIIYSLIGFQNLAAYLNLINKLDNWVLRNGGNPAYEFGTIISKIFVYPLAHGEPVDIRGKLQKGLGAAFAAYQTALAKGKLDEYFAECFARDFCFDARVMKFQEFNLRNMDNFEDFNPKINHRDTLETKVCVHAVVFRNLQIDRYVKDHPLLGLTYPVFKEQVVEGRAPPDFERDYYNRDRFAAYLEEYGQPVRIKALAGLEVPLNHNIHFNPERAYLEERRVHLFSPEHRRIGAIIALQDPRDRLWYNATVHRVEANRIILDLRGDPIDRPRWSAILDEAAILT